MSSLINLFVLFLTGLDYLPFILHRNYEQEKIAWPRKTTHPPQRLFRNFCASTPPPPLD